MSPLSYIWHDASSDTPQDKIIEERSTVTIGKT